MQSSSLLHSMSPPITDNHSLENGNPTTTTATTTNTTATDGRFTAKGSTRNMPSTLWIVLISSIIMNVTFIARANNQQQHPIMIDNSLSPPAASSSTSKTVVYVSGNHIYLDPSRGPSSPWSSSSAFTYTSNSSTSSSLSSPLVGPTVATTSRVVGKNKEDNRKVVVPSSVRLKNDHNDGKEFLLTVPFYIYEELLWTNLNHVTMGNDRIDQFANHKFANKHSDDYYFVQWAMQHPMRTYNASEAQIFVVPFLENAYDTDIKLSNRTGRHLCVEGRCSQHYMQHMIHTMSSSPYLGRKPHIMVGSHCHSLFSPKQVLKPKSYRTILNQMYVIVFENVPKGKKISIRKHLNRYRDLVQQASTQELDTNTGIKHIYRRGLPTTYVGRGCPFDPKRKRDYDIAFISKTTFQQWDRKFIYKSLTGIDLNRNTTKTQMNQYDWMKYVVNDRKVPWDKRMPVLPMPQRPSLANARYGFHVAGDSPSSDRLLATILSGTIPIFTRLVQYDMVPDWIDWNAISVFIDLMRIGKNQELFLQELRTILEDEEGYQRRYKALLENIKLFDWVHTINPFDMYMYRIQAEEYPDTRHVDPTRIWSVMPNHLLPPPIPSKAK